MQLQAAFDTTRPFGVEIETVGNRNISGIQIARALNAAGILTENQGYNHRDVSIWKIVPDVTCGLEIVSPKLYGADGLEQIKTVCQVLTGLGLTVNHTTGLHVHHDASDVTGKQMKSLLNLSVKAQPFMDALLPSRVGSRWCAPITASAVRAIERSVMPSDRGSARYYAQGFNRVLGRYHTVNLSAYFGHGTIEFRAHTGSLNPMKIAAWVILTQGMLNAAMAKNFTSASFKSVNAKGEGANEARHLFWTLGVARDCEATKAARKHIAARVQGRVSVAEASRARLEVSDRPPTYDPLYWEQQRQHTRGNRPLVS